MTKDLKKLLLLLQEDSTWNQKKSKEYNLFIKDNISYCKCFLNEVKNYSDDIFCFLNTNLEHFIKTNDRIYFTRNAILEKKSFLINFQIMIHEHYHIATRKKNFERYNAIPKEISKKVHELDLKNLEIIKEFEKTNPSPNEILEKISQLEEEDYRNNPEIAEYDRLTKEIKETLYFTNINKKAFELEIVPSPSFSDFVESLSEETKRTLDIYNSYVNPASKPNNTSSDFYSFIDEFVAELQTIKAGVELFDLANDLYLINDEIKIFDFHKSRTNILLDDYKSVLYFAKIMEEFYFIIDLYLDFCKNKKIEFYNKILNDDNFQFFYNNVKEEATKLISKIPEIKTKYEINH